jgi:hypothetical protein
MASILWAYLFGLYEDLILDINNIGESIEEGTVGVKGKEGVPSAKGL